MAAYPQEEEASTAAAAAAAAAATAAAEAAAASASMVLPRVPDTDCPFIIIILSTPPGRERREPRGRR